MTRRPMPAPPLRVPRHLVEKGIVRRPSGPGWRLDEATDHWIHEEPEPRKDGPR